MQSFQMKVVGNHFKRGLLAIISNALLAIISNEQFIKLLEPYICMFSVVYPIYQPKYQGAAIQTILVITFWDVVLIVKSFQTCSLFPFLLTVPRCDL